MKKYISQKFETVDVNGTEYDVNLFVKGDEEHTMPCDCCCLLQYPFPCEQYCRELGYSAAFSEAIFLTKTEKTT